MTPAERAERLAECLIAIYGQALAISKDRKVRVGAHPGEELSRLFTETISEAIREAVEAEREACARMVTNNCGCYDGFRCSCTEAAKVIRARGKEGA